MRQIKILILVGCFYNISFSQDNPAILNYINTYKDIAISEMKRTGVPAAIKLAQGIHETNAGESMLVKKSNNHFGIKCKDDWNGATVRHTDDARNECFRKYNSPFDSYRDHSDFLLSRTWYASLFKFSPTDYESWAYGLKKAGYATNPKYPQVIIKLIRDYQLQRFTMSALEIGEPTDELTLSQDDLTKINQIELKVSYPDNDFFINNTKVIYAQKGISYLFIAKKYGVDLAKLFEFNELAEQEFLTNDQLIYLQRKRKTGNNEQHIVQKGETYYQIAQMEAIRLESLKEYNKLNLNMNAVVGSVLYLRPIAATIRIVSKKQ